MVTYPRHHVMSVCLDLLLNAGYKFLAYLITLGAYVGLIVFGLVAYFVCLRETFTDGRQKEKRSVPVTNATDANDGIIIHCATDSQKDVNGNQEHH